MNICNELLDDALAITAIPVGNELTAIVNSLTPTVSLAEGYFNNERLTGAVTIGMQRDALIPLVRKTGKVKDDESDSVAGRLHTVTVTCEADSREQSIWERLLTLERKAHHLLLTFRSGSQAFVTATADSYLCKVDRDGAKTSVTLRIQNWMGVQMIL